jgi:hypothetical protein
MLSGIIRSLPAAMIAFGLVATATVAPCPAATADPGQDQKFFDLLGQKEIPPVDNANSLIATAKKVCAKLDGGMPAGDLVELMRENGFRENPLSRFQPQDRITRTITQFITASVEAYCPGDRGRIASIAAYRSSTSARVQLASVVIPGHAGEIAPTNPLPVPAQPPPPVPQEVQPAPQQSPPPPRRVQQTPQQAPPPPQEPPPPAEAPLEPPPEAIPPAPAAPGGSAPGGSAPGASGPGGDTGGGSAPAPQPPDQPLPPGHIRLAP